MPCTLWAGVEWAVPHAMTHAHFRQCRSQRRSQLQRTCLVGALTLLARPLAHRVGSDGQAQGNHVLGSSRRCRATLALLVPGKEHRDGKRGVGISAGTAWKLRAPTAVPS